MGGDTVSAGALFKGISESAASFKVRFEPEEVAALAEALSLGTAELQAIASAFEYLEQKHHDSVIQTLLRLSRIPQKAPKTFEGFDFSRIKGRDDRALRQLLCFVKQIFRKSSSNSFGSQHERSSDFTKGCGTYPSFLFPSMSESVTRRLSPLNSTSLPWWTILSTSADASLSSANTVPHFPNSMLVVSTIDWRS